MWIGLDKSDGAAYPEPVFREDPPIDMTPCISPSVKVARAPGLADDDFEQMPSRGVVPESESILVRTLKWLSLILDLPWNRGKFGLSDHERVLLMSRDQAVNAYDHLERLIKKAYEAPVSPSLEEKIQKIELLSSQLFNFIVADHTEVSAIITPKMLNWFSKACHNPRQ